ncbi:N-ethylammeline chlorohydrolase [Achromatium sp. WMS2]|nr:N-ethylammeline chlorohydrolase [Achromatium sp. WMS2]
MDVDTLLHAGWIATVDANNSILTQHSLAMNAGRICAILPRTEAKEQLQARLSCDLDGHILIPGLVNCHTHAAMSLLRGIADDLPFNTWLHDYIWPTEARWASEEFVHDGTQLALLEMLRGGTTCFNDMYFFPDVTANAVAKAKMRACIGMIVLDFPTSWADNSDAYFAKGLALHDQFRNNDLIVTAFAPHAPYSVANPNLERIVVLAEELNLPVHIHLHEAEAEIANSMSEYGMRPLERMQDLGLLSPRLVAVHMTQLLPEEISALAVHGSNVVHCPESNLKLASGISPIVDLVNAGVNCALGTDGPASNNDLNLFGEMHTAALLAKGTTGNASALPAAQVLRMATMNGAKALGVESVIGSLELGKDADVVAVDLNAAETTPVYNPVSQLVYASSRFQVRHVWVKGQHLLDNRLAVTLDQDSILKRARVWAERILSQQ